MPGPLTAQDLKGIALFDDGRNPVPLQYPGNIVDLVGAVTPSLDQGWKDVTQYNFPHPGVYCVFVRVFPTSAGVVPGDALAKIDFGSGAGTAGSMIVDVPGSAFVMVPGQNIRVSGRINAAQDAKMFAGIGFAPPAGQYTQPTLTTIGGAVASPGEIVVTKQAFTRQVLAYVDPITASFQLQFRTSGGTVIASLAFAASFAGGAPEMVSPVIVPRGTGQIAVMSAGAALNAATIVEILQ